MDIVVTLQKIMMIGSEWILFLLLILSVMALGIVFERILYFRSVRTCIDNFSENFIKAFENSKTEEMESQCVKCNSPEAKLFALFIKYRTTNIEALERHLNALLAKIQHDLDKNLPFLNTLGNNAPFIGLLGTVFGVISAFHHLAMTNVGSSSIVMTGISEALVATGVGLCVAIPAVVFYNTLIRKVKRRMATLNQVKETLLAIRCSQDYIQNNSKS